MKLRTIIIAGAALLVAGCSAAQNSAFDNSPLGAGFRNLSAGDCTTPAAQQAFAAQLPAFVPEINLVFIVGQFCTAFFGTAPAPATAPGNVPIIPPATPAVPASMKAGGNG